MRSNQLSYKPLVVQKKGSLAARPDESRVADRRRVQGYPLRKEVIQPQVPLRLPCYDLVLLTKLTFSTSLPCGLGQ